MPETAEKEEKRIRDRFHKDPRNAPRYDLRKYRHEEDDPDIDQDPDMKKSQKEGSHEMENSKEGTTDIVRSQQFEEFLKKLVKGKEIDTYKVRTKAKNTVFRINSGSRVDNILFRNGVLLPLSSFNISKGGVHRLAPTDKSKALILGFLDFLKTNKQGAPQDLGKFEKTLTHYLTPYVQDLAQMDIPEMKELLNHGLEESSVSEPYKRKVKHELATKIWSPEKLRKFIVNIVLKGSGQGVITTSLDSEIENGKTASQDAVSFSVIGNVTPIWNWIISADGMQALRSSKIASLWKDTFSRVSLSGDYLLEVVAPKRAGITKESLRAEAQEIIDLYEQASSGDNE